jgi:type I restriction enzyme M protein
MSYRDVPGLCKAATIAEIEAQGWSLNAGRYVGVGGASIEDDQDFSARISDLGNELESLNEKSIRLQSAISGNLKALLAGLRDGN